MGFIMGLEVHWYCVLNNIVHRNKKLEGVPVHEFHWYTDVTVKLSDRRWEAGVILDHRWWGGGCTFPPFIDPRPWPKMELANVMSSNVSGRVFMAWLRTMFWKSLPEGRPIV